MAVQMMKINGKMVPVKKDKNGKWVPMENAEVVVGKDGELEIKKISKKKDEE